MRLAIYLNLLTSTHLAIQLFDAANLSTEKAGAVPLASVEFEKSKNRWNYRGALLPNILSRAETMTVSKLVRANAEALTEGETIKATGITPVLLVRALLSRRAVQVTLDTAAKKFRCVSTMKEGLNTYNLQGLPFGMSVDAEDEEQAVRIAKKEVTAAMIDSPEKAASLAAFFTGGCKVKQATSGALPDFVKLESLADSPAEEKLAKTPVKLASAKDEEA